MIGRYGLWFLGAVLVLGIVLSTRVWESESNRTIELLEQRLTVLEESEINQSELFENLDQLQKRLVALEYTVSNSHWKTKASSAEFLAGAEHAGKEDWNRVYSRIDELEQQLAHVEQQLLNNYSDAEVPPESGELAGTASEALRSSFQLLDKAAETGVLDTENHNQLDEIVSHLDPKSNQIFWERFFADLEAGKYRLPDEEIPAEYVELPYTEVVGE